MADIKMADGTTVDIADDLDGDGVLFLAFNDPDDNFNLFVDKVEWERLKTAIDEVFTRST